MEASIALIVPQLAYEATAVGTENNETVPGHHGKLGVLHKPQD